MNNTGSNHYREKNPNCQPQWNQKAHAVGFVKATTTKTMLVWSLTTKTISHGYSCKNTQRERERVLFFFGGATRGVLGILF